MDFLDLIDVKPSKRRACRVRSWYLYEQYKSLERNQIEATRKVLDKTHLDKLLRQVLSEHRQRRQVCGSTQSEPTADHCHSPTSRSCVSTNISDIIDNFYDVEDFDIACSPKHSKTTFHFHVDDTEVQPVLFDVEDNENLIEPEEYVVCESSEYCFGDKESLHISASSVNLADEVKEELEYLKNTSAEHIEIQFDENDNEQTLEEYGNVENFTNLKREDLTNPECEDLTYPKCEDLTYPICDDLTYPKCEDFSNSKCDDSTNPKYDDLTNPKCEDLSNLKRENFTSPKYENSTNPKCENYTGCGDRASSNNDEEDNEQIETDDESDSICSMRFNTAIDKIQPIPDHNFSMWNRFVSFAYQVIQLNRGNCYYDSSSQFLRAVLLFDVLRRGVCHICNVLQPYVSPVKYTSNQPSILKSIRRLTKRYKKNNSHFREKKKRIINKHNKKHDSDYRKSSNRNVRCFQWNTLQHTQHSHLEHKIKSMEEVYVNLNSRGISKHCNRCLDQFINRVEETRFDLSTYETIATLMSDNRRKSSTICNMNSQITPQHNSSTKVTNPMLHLGSYIDSFIDIG